jgi:CRP-like cAMP-binding protein
MAGLVVALVALSAGQILAASLLAGAGGEVYPRKFVASLVWLHVRFDLGDRKLLRPFEQALIKLAANLPLSAALLVALMKFPAAAPSLAAVWLLAWRPWGAGLFRRLAGLLNRYPHLDTDTRFLFLPNQRPQLHWRAWWRRWDWRVCALELVWAAGWSLLVARIVLDAFELSFVEAASDWDHWSSALPLVGCALLLSIAVIMVRRWRDGLRQAGRRLRQHWARTLRHWRHDYTFPDTEAALLRVAAAHPLLGQLSPYDQAVIVRAWRPVTRKAWTPLADAEAEGSHVGLILSGRATASRTGRSGRQVRALSLAEGDFFGLPHLKPGGDALLGVRSRTPIAAMLLPMPVFKDVVMTRLDPEAIYDLTHKYAFLQRLPVCAYWHMHAVARFARLSQITSYSDGDFILREQDDARWFYILYEGIAHVRSRGKLKSRLKAGDFFGEISLLQNSVTVADVVAHGTVRCLQIDRTSFLRFMTHNHHVALQLEKISSARLGRPVFPLMPGM